MSKWYEVEVQTLIVYAVEVNESQNENHAIDLALSFAPHKGISSGSAEPLPNSHLSMIRKNADVVLSLDGTFDDDDDE